MIQDHERYMKRCLELAAVARGNSKTAVGALITRNGMIIEEGVEGAGNLHAVLCHAEAVAIVDAITHTGSNDLSGCTLYTTVEPCFMCAYLIRRMKISRVVFGTTTEGVGGASSAYPILRATDIDKWTAAPVIIEGILKEACLNMLKE